MHYLKPGLFWHVRILYLMVRGPGMHRCCQSASAYELIILPDIEMRREGDRRRKVDISPGRDFFCDRIKKPLGRRKGISLGIDQWRHEGGMAHMHRLHPPGICLWGSGPKRGIKRSGYCHHVGCGICWKLAVHPFICLMCRPPSSVHTPPRPPQSPPRPLPGRGS